MDLRACEGVEIGALGQVLTDEVGVLVESALPGMVGWAAGACSGCVSTGFLGLERGMRPEYSTTGARKQEGLGVRSV